MSKVTKLKVKQPDGSFSSDIDLGAKASNVSLEEGKDLQTKIGELDTSISGFEVYKTTTDRRLDSVEAKVTAIYRPMGSVQSYSELADKQATAEIGDVWNVIDTDKNYAWTAQSTWDDLGGKVDLTNYYTKEQTYSSSEVDEKIESVIAGDLADYVKTADAEKTYAKQTDLTDLSNSAVKTSGDQSIGGTKTFTSIPVLPSTDPTLDTQSASKGYVDKTVQSATPNVGKLVTNATEAQTASAGESFGGNITLHKIAKTGSYNDLNDKPVIPTPVTVENSLVSTSTTNALSANQGKVLNEKIPTRVSQLNNDTGFIKMEKASNEADALSKSQSNPNVLYYWTE